MATFYLYSSPYLSHHGIKGMKWGVRRYQNRDGSYTMAGRLRYGIGERMAKDQKNAYERFKEMGLSDKRALELSEEKKEMLKKIAIGTGIAIGSAAIITAAYYGKPYIQRNILGITIRAGQTIQTLSKDPNRIQNGADFYAAIRERDKERYINRWGQYSEFGRTGLYKRNKYNIQARAIKNLKIAPNNKVSKIMNELIKKDKDFAEYAKEQIVKQDSPFNFGYKKHAELAREIKKNPDKLYNLNPREQKLLFEAINLRQVDHDVRINKLTDVLKQKGFAGMIDTNDAKLLGGSRFNTNAVIIFSGNKGILQKSVTELSDKQIHNAKIIDHYVQIANENLYKSPAIAALYGITVGSLYGIGKEIEADREGKDNIINRRLNK